MPSLLLRNATILTMDDGLSVVHGSVSIRDGRIAAVGDVAEAGHDSVIDARGGYVLPGFVQTHIHLCQTLFRGDRKSTRLNSSHHRLSRMPSSA